MGKSWGKILLRKETGGNDGREKGGKWMASVGQFNAAATCGRRGFDLLGWDGEQ